MQTRRTVIAGHPPGRRRFPPDLEAPVPGAAGRLS